MSEIFMVKIYEDWYACSSCELEAHIYAQEARRDIERVLQEIEKAMGVKSDVTVGEFNVRVIKCHTNQK